MNAQIHPTALVDAVVNLGANVKIGPYDYNLATNSQLPSIAEINSMPLKTVGNAPVTVADVGEAKDGAGR